MKEKYYTIAQVCKITGLPRSTIRFWCENNMIQVKQDPNNRYHIFTDTDIWALFDMMRSREKGLPMEYLDKAYDIPDWYHLHEVALEQLNAQKEKLEQQIDEIHYTLSQMDEIERLKKVTFVKETPHFYKIVERDFANPELRKLFKSTLRSVATFATINDDLTYKPYKSAAVPKDFECNNPLWVLNEDEDFYAALIIRRVKTKFDNTTDVFQAMVDAGLKPQYMIVYSLAADSKNDYIYFKAYIRADKIK